MIINKTNPKKITKLIEKLEGIASTLEGARGLNIHRRVNQFYYMQKAAEFKVLLERLSEAERRLDWLAKCIEQEYTIAFNHWRNDLRWLNSSTVRT
jgi:hypothetical protein